jgi:hypothetical protein
MQHWSQDDEKNSEQNERTSLHFIASINCLAASRATFAGLHGDKLLRRNLVEYLFADKQYGKRKADEEQD